MDDDTVFAVEVFYGADDELMRPIERGIGFELATYHRWCDPDCHPAIIKHITGLGYVLLTDRDELFNANSGCEVPAQSRAKALAAFSPDDILSAQFEAELEWIYIHTSFDILQEIDTEIIEDLQVCLSPETSSPPLNTSKPALLSSSAWPSMIMQINPPLIMPDYRLWVPAHGQSLFPAPR